MSITRHGITDGTHGRAIVRRAVVRGDTVYLCGVTPDPAGDRSTCSTASTTSSPRPARTSRSASWRRCGSRTGGGSRCTTRSGNAWFDHSHPPDARVRAGRPVRSGILVEIMVAGAKGRDTA